MDLAAVKAAYTPSLWQQEFHQLTCHEALGAGAAGPGKSTCLRMEPLAQIILEHQRFENDEHPYHIRKGESQGYALYIRREADMLGDTITQAKRIYKLVDPGVKWVNDSGGGTLTFTSGYKYRFGHCKDPDDWEKYQGDQYTMILYDELTQMLEEQYNQINTRLRTGDPLLNQMKKIRAMSNPMMRRGTSNFVIRDPHWVRKYFVDEAPSGRTLLRRRVILSDGTVEHRDRIYLPATLHDNPDKGFVKSYELELADKPQHIRQALLFGNWYAVADAFFAEYWSPQLHVKKPFRIPRYWHIFRSMDWGHKHPGCVGYYALDDDDHLWKFKEITFQGKSDVEVAEILKEYEIRAGFWKNGRSMLTGPADTQLWENRGGYGRTKAQVFASRGIPWVAAAKQATSQGRGGRRSNAQELSKRLRDHGQGSKEPGIVFFSTCVRTIQTIPNIPTDPTDTEQPMEGGDDHWLDETLYACEYASRGNAQIRTVQAIEDDDDDFASDEARGQHGYGLW